MPCNEPMHVFIKINSYIIAKLLPVRSISRLAVGCLLSALCERGTVLPPKRNAMEMKSTKEKKNELIKHRKLQLRTCCGMFFFGCDET